jgi:hypothetical protein
LRSADRYTLALMRLVAGFIIGYVGGTHIPVSKKDSHAKMLMSGALAGWPCLGNTGPVLDPSWCRLAGSRSRDGRGAEIVVEDFRNVVRLVEAFGEHISKNEGDGNRQFTVPENLAESLMGRVWQPGSD